MIRKMLLIFACVCVLELYSSAQAETSVAAPQTKVLTFAGDLWCPVNCEADSLQPGFGVELLKQIYEPLGYTINYVIMPWARAVEEANSGKISGVIGALKEDAPKLIFPREPLVSISDDIYVTSTTSLTFNGIQSLKGQSVGIIDGYSYSPKVMNYLSEAMRIPGAVQAVSGDDAIEQNIRKLLAGRITAVIESAITMDYTLRQLDLTDQIKHIGGVPSGKIYIAFAANSLQSPTLRRQFDQGMSKIRRNGTLSRIYSTYGVAP